MELISQQRFDGVTVLTLDRPERLNALSKPLLKRLDEIFVELASDERTRVVVITGSGTRAFSAGADIEEQRGFSPEDAYAHMRWGQAIFDRIETLPKPTIAALNGVALGGGLELAIACDMRFAADTARLGTPEITLASFPGWGGTQRLPALVGTSRAFRMMYSGELMSSQWAYEVGLVDDVVNATALIDRTLTVAHSIARHSSEAHATLKAVVRAGLIEGRAVGLAREASGVAKLWGSPAQQAAQEVFFARKKH
ncbi:enoyl-CoA hydratase/isomerase family protein [Caballeronia sp. HLA56]